MNINEIIARAESLRKETALNSIDPERVGSIMSDTLKWLNEFQLTSNSLGLDKIYSSVDEMNSDAAPVSDLTGKPLKAGQLAVIVASGEEDEDNGKVYRFDNPGWTYVSIIGNLNIVQETGNSETAVMSQKAVTDYLNAGYLYKGIANPSTDPGTPTQRVFYIAMQSGTYVNFDNIEIENYPAIISRTDGTWRRSSLSLVTTSNIRQYAYLLTTPITITVADRTVKIPVQNIILNGRGLVAAATAFPNGEVTLTESVGAWGSWHIIYNNAEHSFSLLENQNQKPLLSDDEYYFATVRFSGRGSVLEINAQEYIIDGVKYNKAIPQSILEYFSGEAKTTTVRVGSGLNKFRDSVGTGTITISCDADINSGMAILLSASSSGGSGTTFNFLSYPKAGEQYKFYISSRWKDALYVQITAIESVENASVTIDFQPEDAPLVDNRVTLNNIRKYVYLLSSPISISTTERTVKIPAQQLSFNGRTILSAEDGFPDGDVTLTETFGAWGTWIIIYNTLYRRFYLLESLYANPILQDYEYYFATVRFSGIGSVLEINSPEWIIDGVRYTKNCKVSQDVNVQSIAPCMYNPPVDLKKAELKVLDIGNSYTQDSVALLSQITQASGSDVSDMCMYTATRGGASFKSWVDVYNNEDTTTYTISKLMGDLASDVETGTGQAGDGTLFRNLLKDNTWDIIMIHQVSAYSPYFDEWQGKSNAGYLNELIRIIRKNQPSCKIGFLLVHSYMSDYSGNAERSALERWKLIAQSAKDLRAQFGIDFIVPYGTAIQNLRASSLNNEYDLTRDGTHLGYGLARYTAACCYYQALIAPRSGISVYGNTARYTVPENDKNVTYPSSCIDVTDDNALTAQKAALAATYKWYDVVNPDTMVDIL